MDKVLPGCFTIEFDGLRDQLRSEVTIFLPGSNRTFSCFAIWDTGANESSITKNVIDHLKLRGLKIGDTKVQGVLTEKEVKRDAYAIGVTIENSVSINFLRVHDNQFLDLPENGMLLGMDVIQRGNFVVSNQGGKTRLSFQYPALEPISLAPNRLVDY